MKTLFTALTLLVSASTYACQCSKETLDEWKPIQSYIKTNYGVTVDLENDITWSAYYPGLIERVFSGDLSGSSCAYEGPRGETYIMCQSSRKSDYIVTLPDTNCQVKLRVKSNFKRVKIRELSSGCKL